MTTGVFSAATLASLLPLASAVIYVIEALLVKRSNEYGVGVWRTAFVSNLASAILFQLLLPLGGTVNVELWWQPVVVAGVFMLGQIFNFLSLQRGDVSVATPVLGLKVILVALFSTLLLGHPVPLVLWAAAALSSLAIILLNLTGSRHHHHVPLTILFAGLSAASFAAFDVLVQKWSPSWGPGRFLPVMMAIAAVMSLTLMPMFPAPLRAIPRACLAVAAGRLLGVFGPGGDVHHDHRQFSQRDGCQHHVQLARTVERGGRVAHRPLVRQSRAPSRPGGLSLALARRRAVDDGDRAGPHALTATAPGCSG